MPVKTILADQVSQAAAFGTADIKGQAENAMCAIACPPDHYFENKGSEWLEKYNFTCCVPPPAGPKTEEVSPSPDRRDSYDDRDERSDYPDRYDYKR